tara:strand:- start:1311 stop:2816 length:1506 start_codon:yes stop_codon:yes gene_type:complete
MSLLLFNSTILFLFILILFCGLNFIPKLIKVNPQNYRTTPFSTFDLIDYVKFFSMYISASIAYHFIFFNTVALSLSWIISCLIIVLSFIVLFFVMFVKLIDLDDKTFIIKIVIISGILRLLTVLITYLVGFYFTGTEFEVDASDSIKYHTIASELLKIYENGGSLFIPLPIELDDYGYIYFNTIIYWLFYPSTILMRIINAFFGTLTILIIYNYSKLLMHIFKARLVAITSSLFPFFLYFTGVQMKETLMLFSVIMTLYFSTKLIVLEKINLHNLFFAAFSVISIFLFRYSLGVIVFLTVVSIFIFNKKTNRNVAFAFIIILGSMLLFSQVGLIDELFLVISNISDYSSTQLGKSRSLADVSFLTFFTFGFFGPFPGLVDIPAPLGKLHSSTLYQLGGIFILSFLKGFFVLSIIYIIKNNVKRYYPLIFFYFTYHFALSLTALTLDIRFQIVNNMILIILFPVIVGRINSRDKYILFGYTIIIFLGTVFWNYARALGNNLL